MDGAHYTFFSIVCHSIPFRLSEDRKEEYGIISVALKEEKE
jgi:hypothetical protein